MQIVIDIPEDIYEHWRTMKSIISEYHNYKEYMSKVHAAIADGTPLPKGHGRLIDADKLHFDLQADEEIPLCAHLLRVKERHILWAKERINGQPTIIKADKEET